MNTKLLFFLLCYLYSFVVNCQCACEQLTYQGTIVTVGTVDELKQALDQANDSNGNMTIELKAGIYNLDTNLRFINESMSNLIITGSTTNRNDVMIKGLGWDDNSVTHIFNIAADNVTIANMTIGEVYYHAIQVHSNPVAADNFLLQNVRIVDVKEQLLKVSGGGELFSNNGSVMCSEFEFTAGIGYQYYTGGIDAHRAKDWNIKYNVFRGIRSPESDIAEHAIHMWRESSGTLVEGNRIMNCDRGIGFGLGPDHDDGHTGGIIVNNFVHTNRDVGIGLESSTYTKVYHNTVITESYPRSIEYRFERTNNVVIANNLVNGEISDRSSGSTATLESNYTVSDMSYFTNPSIYDYHLSENAFDVIDNGKLLPEVTLDLDCELRLLGSAVDIGADELDITSSVGLIADEPIISLAPNPNSGNFSISGMAGNFNILIFHNDNLLIQYIDQSFHSTEIDLSALPTGLYFVRLENRKSGKSYVHKVIKL